MLIFFVFLLVSATAQTVPTYVASTSGTAQHIFLVTTVTPTFSFATSEQAANAWVPSQDPTVSQPVTPPGVYGQWAEASFPESFYLADVYITSTFHGAHWVILGSNNGVTYAQACLTQYGAVSYQLQADQDWYRVGCSNTVTPYSIYRFVTTPMPDGANITSIVLLANSAMSISAIPLQAVPAGVASVIPPTPPASGAVLMMSQRNLLFPASAFPIQMNGRSGTPGEEYHFFSQLSQVYTYPPPYEFYLVYKDLNVTNHWTQTSAPTPLQGRGVDNYVPISVGAPYCYSNIYVPPNSYPSWTDPFGGLMFDQESYSSNAAFGGSTHTQGACFVVAGPQVYTSNYVGSWPAYATSSTSTSVVTSSWTELWLVPHGAATTPGLPLAPLPTTPVPLDTSSYTGFDVIVIAGQSNSVGFSGNTGRGAEDDTSTLPIYVSLGGHGDGVPQGSYVTRANESYYQIQEYTGGGANEFSVGFAKAYVRNGFLAPGRAVLLVSTGVGGTAFLNLGLPQSNTPNVQQTPGPNTTIIETWTSSLACESNAYDSYFSKYGNIATQYNQPNLRMTLLGHAQYQIDAALSINPLTGVAPTSGPISYYPENKVAAILWHQGESDVDFEGSPFPVTFGNGTVYTCSYECTSWWAGCLSNLADTLRTRYTPTGGPVVPFLVGGYVHGYAEPKMHWYRKNFGGGRYKNTITTAPPLNLATGNTNVGFADSYTDFYGNSDVLQGDGVHFYQRAYQQLGLRYAQAYSNLFGNALPGTLPPPGTPSPPPLANPPPAQPPVAQPPPLASPPVAASPPLLIPSPPLQSPPPTQQDNLPSSANGASNSPFPAPGSSNSSALPAPTPKVSTALLISIIVPIGTIICLCGGCLCLELRKPKKQKKNTKKNDGRIHHAPRYALF